MVAPEPASQPERLVLYDGECGFCNHAVRWILDADSTGRFSFAPLGGATAAAILARHPELPRDLDSIVYVEHTQSTERVAIRADAIFAICSQLDAPRFRRVAQLRALPAWLAELGYRAFAARRRSVSKRMGACPLPSPAERQRFLP